MQCWLLWLLLCWKIHLVCSYILMMRIWVFWFHSVVIMISAIRTSFIVVSDFSGQSWSRGSDVKWWHFRRWYSTWPGRGNATVLLSVVEVTWNGRLHLLFSFFWRIFILWLKEMKNYILYHWQFKHITWRNKRYNWMGESNLLDKIVFHMFVYFKQAKLCMFNFLKDWHVWLVTTGWQ